MYRNPMKRLLFLLLLYVFQLITITTKAQQNGILCGMTEDGGINSAGNVFSINTLSGNQFTNLISFKKDTSGYNPFGNLVQDTNGILYGMTNNQSTQYGTIFSYDLSSGSFSVIHQFINTDGAFPKGSLTVGPGGILYGMTPFGGTGGGGVLFSIDPNTRQYTLLLNITNPIGVNPTGNLIFGKDGLLYGMTDNGSSTYGTLFSFNISNKQSKILFNFDLTHGAYPKGSLIQATDSLLYGLTSQGGMADSGVLFSYNILTNTQSVLVSFTDSIGVLPSGSLVQAKDSCLYGMTQLGGVNNMGTIFKYNIVSGKVNKVFSFSGSKTGANPHGSLIQANDGWLYGMTDSGGKYNNGVVFKIDPVSLQQDTLLSFSGSNGANPYGDLLEAMSASLSKKDNPCFGDSLGSAVINVHGGRYPLIYSWSNGATTDSVSGLAAGNYTAKVTDQKGITYNFNFTIGQPAQIRDSVKQAINVSCYGESNGSAVIGIKGGVLPYTYSWSSSEGTNQAANNLVAGSYTCSIADANNCSDLVTVTITQPAILRDSTVSQTNLTCYGHNTGSADVGATGGTAPYQYSWSLAMVSGSSVNNLAAGTYTCTVTDLNSCVTQDTIVITTPAQITYVTTFTATPCAKNNGSVAVNSVSGGIPPYTYQWSAGSTNASDTALAAGSYTCTITDSELCSVSPIVTLPNVGGPKDSIIQFKNVPCYGDSNGTATATSVGGTAPYLYSWSPTGGTDTIAVGLKAGTYTFTTTDFTGCIGSATVTITEPAAIRDSIAAITEASCYGSKNGSVSVGVIGGIQPYTYSWSTGAMGAIDSLLAAGSYTCNITDANNCIATKLVMSIKSPDSLSIDTAATLTKCGNKNGTVNVIVSGGTPPYSYLWNSGQKTDSIFSLPGGSYTCTITDAHSCISKVNIVVPDTGGPTASIVSQINNVCYGYKGGNVIISANGVPPYTYSWNNGVTSTSFIATNLPAGEFICTVKDSTGCNGQVTVTITQPGEIVPLIQTVGVCSGELTGGFATVTSISGGIVPYSLSWSNGSTSDTITNLSPGNYFCKVTDSNTCSVFDTFSIIQTAPLVIKSITVQPAWCNACANGSVLVSVSGGIPLGDSSYYFYIWSNGITGDSIISNIDTGAYSVCITSPYGCGSICDSAIVVTGISSVTNPSYSLKIYPNPSNGQLFIELPVSGPAILAITNELGQQVYSQPVEPEAGSNKVALNLESLPDGLYVAKISSEKGVSIGKIVIQK
ncbi:MAG TPA: choice-of-anchor tandem repeat GloVer-containing protein [Bacteroidia bacterium]|nr:choice-of-anchor tandem repeat GloVer-containing protein [Bacteroidia bacterium]